MSQCGNVTSRAAARDFSFGFVDMYLFFDILAIRLSGYPTAKPEPRSIPPSCRPQQLPGWPANATGATY